MTLFPPIHYRVVLQQNARFFDVEEKYKLLSGKTASLLEMEEEVTKVSKKVCFVSIGAVYPSLSREEQGTKTLCRDFYALLCVFMLLCVLVLSLSCLSHNVGPSPLLFSPCRHVCVIHVFIAAVIRASWIVQPIQLN